MPRILLMRWGLVFLLLWTTSCAEGFLDQPRRTLRLLTKISFSATDTSPDPSSDPIIGDSQEGSDCTPSGLEQATNQCKYVRTHCTEPFGSGFLNYMDLRFCHPELPPLGWYLVFGVELFLLLYAVAFIADAHFLPSLEHLSTACKMGPNLAGVTFLAFGNGAGDVSSMIAAVVSGTGADLGISEPAGAGLFVTTIVMSMVIASSSAIVPWRPFVRDAGFYLIVVLTLWSILAAGTLRWVHGVVLLSIYACYVCVVVTGHAIYKAIHGSLHSLKPRSAASSPRASTRTASNFLRPPAPAALILPGGDRSTPLNVNIEATPSEDERKWLLKTPSPLPSPLSSSPAILLADAGLHASLNQHHQGKPNYSAIVDTAEFETGEGEGNALLDLSPSIASSSRRYGRCGPCRSCIHSFQYLGWQLRSEWAEMNSRERVAYVLNLPYMLLFGLTIPPSCEDQEDWNQLGATLSPVGAVVLVLLGFGLRAQTIVLPVVICAMLGGLVIFSCSNVRRRPRWFFLLTLGAFIMSVVWIYFLANEVVNLLQAFGVMFDLSEVTLAITLLALGNSLPDMVADTTVAREGYPSMATGAIYGGQMFNMVMGLGVSFIYTGVVHPEATVMLCEETALVLVMLVLSLLSALVVVIRTGGVIPRWFAVWLIVLYSSYGLILGLNSYHKLPLGWIPGSHQC